MEGLWARGDRRLGRLLIAAYNKGCKFDGWSDRFQYHLWEESFEETHIDPDFYTSRPRDVCEPLPWDHIDTRVSKSFLIEEWEHALDQALTDDCRLSDCNHCGVCDFEEIELKTYEAFKKENSKYLQAVAEKPAMFKKVYVYYSKQNQAKYFGHLEMVNIFLRALRRAQIPVKFTEGFHPKAKISFDDPLPVGMESQEERFMLTVSDFVKPHTIIEHLNAHLPEGLWVHHCQPVPLTSNQNADQVNYYRVRLQESAFEVRKIERFSAQLRCNFFAFESKRKVEKYRFKGYGYEYQIT